MDITAGYDRARAHQVTLENDVKAAAAVMQTYPTGAMGLTPDSVKFSPGYRRDRENYRAAFERLRAFNGKFVKAFAREIRAERRNRKPG